MLNQRQLLEFSIALASDATQRQQPINNVFSLHRKIKHKVAQLVSMNDMSHNFITTMGQSIIVARVRST
jgi:hypothetical protein